MSKEAVDVILSPTMNLIFCVVWFDAVGQVISLPSHEQVYSFADHWIRMPSETHSST